MLFRSIARRIDSYQVEKRYICKDGRIMWGRLTVSLLHPVGEESHRFVAMVEDITDRKRAESDSLQREAELKVIANLSLVMRQATSYPQVIEGLVEHAAIALSARACGLLLLEDQRLRLVANRGLNISKESLEIPEDDGLAWQTIRSDQTVCQSRDVDGRRQPQDAIQTLCESAQLIALVPLRSSDIAVGLLYLAFDQPSDLAPSVRKLLESAADIASNAIQRAKLLQTLEQQVSDRTRRLKLLYEVSAAASQSFDLRTILLTALQMLVAAMPGSAGALLLLDDKRDCQLPMVCDHLSAEICAELDHGFTLDAPWTRVLQDGLRLQLSKGSQGRRVPDWLQSAGWQAYLGVPVRVADETVGVLSLFWRSEPRLSIDDLESISAVAAEIGRSVERSELRTQAELALIAEERQRLARDLHDSITQLLCGQALLAEASRNLVRSGDASEAEPYLEQLVETAQQALKEMRLMIYNLRPSVLAAEGLMGAIHWRLQAVEQRAGIQAQLIGEVTASLSKQDEEGLYWVVQELLNNVLKHASATSVTVALRDLPDGLEVEVSDDGKGFDPSASKRGIGLRSVQERVERLAGRLDVVSQPGQGCRVLVRLHPISGVC